MLEQSAQNGSVVAGQGHPCLARVERPIVNGSETVVGIMYSDEETSKYMPVTQPCGKVDAEKPMAFQGTDWCCDNHRKLVEAQGDAS